MVVKKNCDTCFAERYIRCKAELDKAKKTIDELYEIINLQNKQKDELCSMLRDIGWDPGMGTINKLKLIKKLFQ